MRRAAVIHIIAISIILACIGCGTVSNNGSSSYGGFKIIDGVRGQPSHVYFAKEVHYRGVNQSTSKTINIMYDSNFVRLLGGHPKPILSDRAPGVGSLYKSMLTFYPIGSNRKVQIVGGTSTNKEFSAYYLSPTQFYSEYNQRPKP